MSVSIGLAGDKKFLRKLKRLASKDIRRALSKGTREGAKVLQPHAKAGAPKRTGKLARAIKERAAKRSRRFVGAVVTVRQTDEDWYAPFKEWGTKKEKGVLFLERAAKSHWRQATEKCNSVIRRHVEEAAKR